MSLFSIDFIKSMFQFKFPDLCSDWSECKLNHELNDFAKHLKEFSNGINELDNAKKIYKLLGEDISDNKVKQQVLLYNNLKQERKKTIIEYNNKYIFKLSPIVNLSSDNDEIWGSKRQYLSGYVMSEIFKNNNITLPPFMCCALNPTGGICGPGNLSMYKGNIDSSLIIHSCMHDASGYCYLYHNIGNGYNYLNSYIALPRYICNSGQLSGILTTYYCKKCLNI